MSNCHICCPNPARVNTRSFSNLTCFFGRIKLVGGMWHFSTFLYLWNDDQHKEPMIQGVFFHFGTENRADQLKQPPCRYKDHLDISRWTINYCHSGFLRFLWGLTSPWMFSDWRCIATFPQFWCIPILSFAKKIDFFIGIWKHVQNSLSPMTHLEGSFGWCSRKFQKFQRKVLFKSEEKEWSWHWQDAIAHLFPSNLECLTKIYFQI